MHLLLNTVCGMDAVPRYIRPNLVEIFLRFS